MSLALPDPQFVSPEGIFKTFNVQETTGLSSTQVTANRGKWGKNEFPEDPKTPYWRLILEQFKDKLVCILLASAGVSFVLAFFEKEEEQLTAFFEPAVIMTILICNAFVGVWQESSAEQAIEALKTYMSQYATVIRGGKKSQIEAVDLVPGDVVEVVAGVQIPADLRMTSLQSTTIRIDQSILTGESNEVLKDPPALKKGQDEGPIYSNMLYSGTSVSYGKALGIVVGTGMATEVGKIQRNMQEQEQVKTPLQNRLDEFGDQLSQVIMVICILVWVINIGHFTDPAHGGALRGAIYYFKIAVALAVAAIPEGLPAVVTTCLALGTAKMAKKNALVRSLPSVETLGCTTVICSDKTGTLTTNMMSVQKVITCKTMNTLNEFTVEDTKFDTWCEDSVSFQGVCVKDPLVDHPSLIDVAICGAMCNDSSLEKRADQPHANRIGEATEACIKVLVEKLGHPDKHRATQLQSLLPEERLLACNEYWESLYQKKQTLEFTRARKTMSAYCTSKENEKKNILFVKGAPEAILERCKDVKLESGKTVILSAPIKEMLMAKLRELGTGKTTLRCLALAFRDDVLEIDDPELVKQMSDPAKFAEVESGLTLVGMVGMLDPPRAEVKDSIQKCHEAGIRVVVITGDHKDTAEAICRRIGVFEENEDTTGRSFTGSEFEKFDDQEKLNAVMHARLFARTDPTHKMLLVSLLQKTGAVVAMTGDGVNDAPALKKADIGIAMGTGTEVAKQASKMVLADDNFKTIVSAVEEGRGIYCNTKQFIRYLISSNIGEVVCIFLTAALGMPEALVPVQLLWVNLVTDGLPATALGFNAPDKNIMKMPPRPSNERIINGWMFLRYCVIGTYVGVATVAGFAWWFTMNEDGPQLSFSQLTSFHNCREGEQSYSCHIFEDNRPSTVSLSVLVCVEMFNALNALSENESIFSIGLFSNLWLLLAIAMSILLHLVILYTPICRTIFGVAALTWPEWMAVLALSAPVIVVDETMKLIARVLSMGAANRSKKLD